MHACVLQICPKHPWLGKLTDPRGEPTATILQKGQYQIPFCLQLSDLNREVSLYKVTK